MNRAATRLVAAAAGLIALATLAPAAEPEGPQGTLVDLFKDRTPACYARAYDARHLAANPAQTVTFLALVRGYRELLTEEHFRAQAPDQLLDWRETTLRVAFRDTGRQRWESRAACTVENGRIECSSGDCDGGTFTIEREAAGTLLLTVVTGDTSPVRLGGACGSSEASRGLGRGKEDRVFRLAAAPPDQCR